MGKVYYKFDDGTYEKQIIYCNNHKDEEETDEEIIRAMSSEFFLGKFDKSTMKHTHDIIKDDSHCYVCRSLDHGISIWRICGKVHDTEGAIIPNTYYVQRIGSVFMV